MRKNLPRIILGLVVTVVVAANMGYSSLDKGSTPQVDRDVKVSPAQIVGDDTSSGKPINTDIEEKIISSENAGKRDKAGKGDEAETPAEVDSKAGEIMVYGEVKATDVYKRILTIDQHMDDNSVKISPNVPVSKDAIIRNKIEVISLAQIKYGDTVGVIVSKDLQARAVLVNY
ncbi:MAG TPA: hypothetical protein VNT57_00375 [Desulfobacteria bacterium]|nr:hypothetical protein [Desulfobacteria bacterium]